MSRLATFASGPEQRRWTLPALPFSRPDTADRSTRTVARSLAPRRAAEKAGKVVAYALSGIVYLGVLAAVFWV